MTGAGVDQHALARVIGGGHDGRERAPELALEHGSGRLQGAARRQAGLEVGAQREAHERRVGQRLAPVPGDVADDHRQPAVLEREHVVEVAARPRAVCRPVGRGGADRTEPAGGNGQQRSLQQTDVLEQLRTLALQPPRAQRDQRERSPEREREREQHADEHPHRQRGRRRRSW